MVHTDCFAYNESDNEKQQCCALVSRICENKNCSFYKTSEQCDNETRKLIREQKEMFEKDSK